MVIVYKSIRVEKFGMYIGRVACVVCMICAAYTMSLELVC